MTAALVVAAYLFGVAVGWTLGAGLPPEAPAGNNR
jgi:hypothetical protein